METPRLARSLVLASFLGTALVGGAALDAAVPQEAEAGYDIDESYFYMSLSSYGSWVQNAQFGWVWYPTHRDRYWRPYTVGSWAWTDYGEWMWVSDEPFGWATYHYGRWFLDPFYGWVWLPGRVWAPAWVSWRDGGDYIGWSPLGPWGYWDSGRNCYRDWDRYGGGYYGGGYHDGGYHDGDHHDGDHHDGDHGGGGHGDGGHGDGDHDYDRGRRYHDNHDTWNFTRKRDFASDRVDRVVIDRQHLPEVYRKSRDLPPPSVQEEREGRGVTRAIDRSVIERAAGRPIRPVKVENADAPTVAGRRDASPDRVRVYRPKVSERKPDAKTPDKLGIAKVPDRATRPTPARGGTPGTTGRQPQPPGKERGDSGEPRKAVKPESPRTPARSPARTEQPRGGGSGGQRSGKPDTGAYERPARKDELGGYERAPRKTDPEGYVRPDAGSGRGGSQQPSRVQQPSRTPQPSRVQEPSRSQQPSRVQQPSRSQPPSRVQQPTRSQPPSRVQQPTRSQPPSRVQQPSRGGSVAPRSPAPAPATQRAPSSYNRPASPSGGSSGGGVQGGGGSPQGRGTYSQPQGSRGGQPSGAGGVSHGGGGSHGGSPGGGTGGPRGH